MPTVTTEYYGVLGSGRNVTEAKRNASEKIKAALSGRYEPFIVSWRGFASLIYRDPHCGWCSRIITHGGKIDDGHVYGSTGPDRDDLNAVIQDERCNLAQLAWEPDDGIEPPPFISDQRKQAEFKYWAEFQLRYREARRRGMNDNDAHSYAGRNPARAELWLDSENREI